jgi:peptidoglycan/xylan/chitin deacetylase (PgdA/CDA1 family)
VTHPRLAAVDDARLVDELQQSRETLERLLGEPIRLLALPYGSCSDRVVAAAARTGYDRVFANVPVRDGDSHSPVVGRVDVTPADWPLEFRLKVLGAYDWMGVAIPLKRRLGALTPRTT